MPPDPNFTEGAAQAILDGLATATRNEANGFEIAATIARALEDAGYHLVTADEAAIARIDAQLVLGLARRAVEVLQEPPDRWVVLELMGHGRRAGRMTEEVVAGTEFVRLDVPSEDDGSYTTLLINPRAVYAVNPVGEKAARAVAAHTQPAPVHPWELPDDRTDDDGVF